MIYLHKILPFFLSPLGIILIFLIASFFFKRRIFVFLAFIVLVISSNPIVGNYLMQKLEYPYKPISSNSIRKALQTASDKNLDPIRTVRDGGYGLFTNKII